MLNSVVVGCYKVVECTVFCAVVTIVLYSGGSCPTLTTARC